MWESSGCFLGESLCVSWFVVVLCFQLNGTVVCEVKLRVSMARRQPTFEGVQDPSSSSWSTIGGCMY